MHVMNGILRGEVHTQYLSKKSNKVQHYHFMLAGICIPTSTKRWNRNRVYGQTKQSIIILHSTSYMKQHKYMNNGLDNSIREIASKVHIGRKPQHERYLGSIPFMEHDVTLQLPSSPTINSVSLICGRFVRQKK